MAEPLKTYGEAEVRRRAPDLPGWDVVDGALERTWELDDFESAIGFVDRVAVLAAARNHHPDIHIRYNEVTLRLRTHSAGGITELDFDLAGEINTL